MATKAKAKPNIQTVLMAVPFLFAGGFIVGMGVTVLSASLHLQAKFQPIAFILGLSGFIGGSFGILMGIAYLCPNKEADSDG